MTIKEQWKDRCREANTLGHHFETFNRILEFMLLELMVIRDVLEEQNEMIDEEPAVESVEADRVVVKVEYDRCAVCGVISHTFMNEIDNHLDGCPLRPQS